MTRDRRGFTLVELIIVTVLGALVVATTLQVLVTNQRTYTAQSAKIQGQQATRAALSVLTGELREVSAQGGDILAMGPDSVSIRVMRKFGVACSVTLGGGAAEVDVIRIGDWFEAGDSVFIFADNSRSRSTDDVWIGAKVTATDTTGTCGSQEATEVTFGSQLALFTADSVRSGAPVRSYVRYTYGLYSLSGESYLARRDAAGDLDPVVGPLRAGDGLAFQYLDADGATTTTRSEVRQILVTLRTESGALNSLGQMVSDSITARIYTRN